MVMRIKFLAALLVIFTLFTVTGCTGGEKQTYSDPKETITVKANRDFVIALEANATTGYAWEAAYDQTILTLVEQNYVADEHEEGMVGVGGTNYLTFKALQTGNTSIELTYKRPWEDDSEGDEKLTFNVTIK